MEGKREQKIGTSGQGRETSKKGHMSSNAVEQPGIRAAEVSLK